MTKPLLAALLCAGLACQPAFAQEEADPVAPRPAVMAPLAAEALLIDAVALDDYAIAVGAFGHILRIDPRLAWAQSPSPVSGQLTAVDFIDDQRGWVVGHDAAILTTDDGGLSWSLQHFAPELEQPLFDVRFIDESRGFAVGAYGLMLRTDDGGETWEEFAYTEDEFADSHLNAIVQVEDALVVVGERGTVYRSPDLGDNWEVVDFPYDGSMFGAVLTPSGRVIAFGLRGHVFASDDAGASWTEVIIEGSVSMNGGRVLSDGRVVLVGMSGVVLVSDDDGETFTRLRDPAGDALAGLFEFDDGGTVLIGESGIREFTIP
jgi:photosystem II stability/assembly factor-like uncharacterized protein